MLLDRETIADVSEHAQTEYPKECCGIITGDGVKQSVHKCINRQDELHAQDPEAHPRNSREAYAIDRSDVERIISAAAQKGARVIAFYHSHIDCGAYFSPMDKEVQTVFGEPEFPEAVHIVLAVYERQVKDIKGFVWDREKQDFLTTSLQ